MKKLALTTLLAAGILLSGCQAPGEQSPEVTSVQTQAALQTAAEPELPPTLAEEPERFTLAEYPCTTDNLRIDGNDPCCSTSGTPPPADSERTAPTATPRCITD